MRFPRSSSASNLFLLLLWCVPAHTTLHSSSPHESMTPSFLPRPLRDPPPLVLPPGDGSEPSTALVPPPVPCIPSPPPGPACCAALKMAAALRGLLRRAVSEGGKAGTSARLPPALTLVSPQVPAAGRTLTAQPLLCARRRLTLGKRGAALPRCAPWWQRGGGGPQCVMCPRRRLAARPGRHAARPVL